MTYRFVVTGAPRTKKTSSRVVRSGGRTRVLPSAAFADWLQAALWQAAEIKPKCAWDLPITEPVAVKALIYREAKRGDATGYYQAVGDFLQVNRGAGFIVDDRQIAHWDGSRLLIDREHPRIDVTLEWPA